MGCSKVSTWLLISKCLTSVPFYTFMDSTFMESFFGKKCHDQRETRSLKGVSCHRKALLQAWLSGSWGRWVPRRRLPCIQLPVPLGAALGHADPLSAPMEGELAWPEMMRSAAQSLFFWCGKKKKTGICELRYSFLCKTFCFIKAQGWRVPWHMSVKTWKIGTIIHNPARKEFY